VDKKIPTKAQQEKQKEHLKRLRQERMIGDFVLTGAALPAVENSIIPQEGYRIYRNSGFFKMNGGCQIVVSVSAEKIKPLLSELMQHIGPVLSISLEDHYSDPQRIIDYLSYDRDIFIIENIIDRYWRLLQNNYDVAMSVFSKTSKVELVLTQVKTLQIHVVDADPFISTLRENGLPEKPDLRLFTEEAYYVYNDYKGTGIMYELTSQLEVHEKRFYDKEPVTR
jgi:hypothetical protein